MKSLIARLINGSGARAAVIPSQEDKVKADLTNIINALDYKRPYGNAFYYRGAAGQFFGQGDKQALVTLVQDRIDNPMLRIKRNRHQYRVSNIRLSFGSSEITQRLENDTAEFRYSELKSDQFSFEFY